MAEVQDFIRWTVGMKLGVPIIDEQHANLVRIVDNLQLSCNKLMSSKLTCGKSTNHAAQRFIGSVQEAIGYMKQHSATEEKLMKLLEYPRYSEHMDEHIEFHDELVSLFIRLKTEENPDFRQFVVFLNERIGTHVCDSDKDFVDYFRSTQHHTKLKVLAVALSSQTA